MRFLKSFTPSCFMFMNKGAFKCSNLYNLSCKRQIFKLTSIRIPDFQNARENLMKSMQDIDKFKEKVKLYCETDDSELIIFSQDLRKLILLAKTDDDLMVVHKLSKKLVKQDNIIRFQNFNFGPEIMRLHYILNKPVEAMVIFEDPDASYLFMQATSLVILLDLLFESKMYKEVLRMFNLIKQRQIDGKRYVSNLVILFYASTYKMNTQESFEESKNLWLKMKNEGFRPHYRCCLFFAMLALNQKHAGVAIEVIDTVNSLASTCIKTMALASSKRFENALSVLRYNLLNDRAWSSEQRFITADTFEFLQEAFKDSDTEYIKKLERTKEDYMAHSLITEEPLDHFLCEELEYGTKDFSKRKIKTSNPL